MAECAILELPKWALVRGTSEVGTMHACSSLAELKAEGRRLPLTPGLKDQLFKNFGLAGLSATKYVVKRPLRARSARFTFAILFELSRRRHHLPSSEKAPGRQTPDCQLCTDSQSTIPDRTGPQQRSASGDWSHLCRYARSLTPPPPFSIIHELP